MVWSSSHRWQRWASPCLVAALSCLACKAQSAFPLRPDDPAAAYLTRDAYGVVADGVADAAPALQKAIDHVQETTHQGIVFIPEGRYRLSTTVHVWSGIRLIGYGAHRPVFLLASHAPGFTSKPSQPMLWFTDEREPAGKPIADASEFTFYSALSNVDFELGDGNPGAVAIRFNTAQHAFVAHAHFKLQSARAAIEEAGNQAYDIQVEGGDYGIVTGKTSAAWQFLLMDSSFTHQRKAAIQSHDAGLTLIRDRFTDTPQAIEIPPGEVEQLYARDVQAENLSTAFLAVGDVGNLRSEISLEHIACSHVGHLLLGAESLPGYAQIAQTPPAFAVDDLTLGLAIGNDGRDDDVKLSTKLHATKALDPLPPSDIAALPPMSSWVNVHSLGVKGDGGTDDTAALQHAIDTHAALYLPSGMYRLTGSLHLRADTALIALSPVTTQLILLNADPHFAGTGPTLAALVAPSGGHSIVTSLGIATGNDNPRAGGVEWLAGPQSLLDDVSLIRVRTGHVPLLEPAAPADRDARTPVRLDQQQASLWVHNGGGGVFRGIWSHAGTARGGLLVENTSTPGEIYQFSCEHHMRVENHFDHVAHWKIFAMQTEEEKPEGAEAFSLQLDATHDTLFANTYMYRVSRISAPVPYAVLAHDAAGVSFRNVKVFSQTRLAFDNTVRDADSGVDVRAHDFTTFALGPALHRGAPLPLPPSFQPSGNVQKLAGGFSNASGLTASPDGTVYFSDAAAHAIYRWNSAAHKADLLAKIEGTPVALGFAAPSTLLVDDYEKAVTAVDTQTGAATLLAEAPPHPGMQWLLPTGMHNEVWNLQRSLEHQGYIYRYGSNTALRSDLVPLHMGYYFAPNSGTAIMGGGTWRTLMQASQLTAFSAGATHYMVSEDDAKTYTATLAASESLTLKTFAERGGSAVVADAEGNVYIAGDQVFVYNRAGHLLGTLEIPERPSSLVFGGPEGKTLFIGARTSLYAIETAAKGSR